MSFRVVATAVLISLCAVAAQQVEIERRVFEIARGLRCPVCISESVADSDAAISIEMRELIQQQIEAGSSDAEIYAFFQARYGDWILLNPPRRGIHLLVWVLPVVVGLAGVVLLIGLVRRWTVRAQTPVEASEGDIGRVRELLERG
jgi:cytochrome c-type biogenesis protein CcmH